MKLEDVANLMTVQATMVIVKKVKELLLGEQESKEGGTDMVLMVEEGDKVEDIMRVMILKMWMIIAIYKILLVADLIEEVTRKRGWVN